MKRLFAWINNSIFGINIVAAVLLAITYLAPLVPAHKFWLIAAWGLSFPVMVAINIGFFIFWLFRRKLQAFLSAVVLTLGLNLLHNTLALNINPKVDTEGLQKIKVLSYNVQNFKLYNWRRDPEPRNKIARLIRQESPDIICFQDFYSEKGGNFENVAYFEQEGYPHSYFVNTLTTKNKNEWGLAIFSKLPITNKGQFLFENSKTNAATWVDVAIDDQNTVRVFNMHLQSFSLADRELEFIQDIATPKENNTKANTKTVENIVGKLKDAYIKRGSQAQTVAAAIAQSPHRAIVCGDFNDTPTSFTYKTIRGNTLKDAFLEAGLGLGGTYAGPLPYLRIDYVLTSSTIKTGRFIVLPYKNSDHYAVAAELYF